MRLMTHDELRAGMERCRLGWTREAGTEFGHLLIQELGLGTVKVLAAVRESGGLTSWWIYDDDGHQIASGSSNEPDVAARTVLTMVLADEKLQERADEPLDREAIERARKALERL